METIGVGLIGTGYMGKCHALAWNVVKPVFGGGPTPRLVHLGEVSQELAKQRAAELGFTRASGDWRAVIADPEVDVVSVTTPNSFHPEMAIAALRAGKHVWCEKPMAPTLAEAERMLAAAKEAAGQVAVLGYNYIQNPVVRKIGGLIVERAIGAVNHFRIEMDEDFMADPEALFFWKSEASSGHGALDDFGVHPLSLIHALLGQVRRVMAHQTKPYDERPLPGGGRRAVETFDTAAVLIELVDGVSGVVMLNRAAWGRKARLTIQVFGSDGAIDFDQERMNEFRLYSRRDPAGEAGFRTILAAPDHPPYDRFVPAPGHGLGFNDLKTIECHELLKLIGGGPAHVVTFGEGIAIERTVHAMARSHAEGRWVNV